MKGMIKMKQTIIRKDGIEYERKAKEKNYNAILYVRIESEKLETLKKIAKNNNENYSEMIRNLINEFIERNNEV